MYLIYLDYFEAAKRNLDLTTSELVTSPHVAKECNSVAKSVFACEQTAVTDPVPHSKQSSLQRFQTRIVSELIHICN